MTPFAEQVARLTNTLNCQPGERLPGYIVDPGAYGLPHAARHDTRAGQGDDREADAGNKAGPALMLAVLLPHVYGVPSAAPLRVCGWPPQDYITRICSKPAPRSGDGPDNHRMNIWEALMNHWLTDHRMVKVRELIYVILVGFRTGIDLLDLGGQPAWKVPRQVLQLDVQKGLGNRERDLHGNMV